MVYESLKKDIFDVYNKSGQFPEYIKVNKDVYRNLKETGYISLAAADPSKVTFLGVEVHEDSNVNHYEIC